MREPESAKPVQLTLTPTLQQQLKKHAGFADVSVSEFSESLLWRCLLEWDYVSSLEYSDRPVRRKAGRPKKVSPHPE